MSADNGIYILKTNGGEYRVAECAAIENIYEPTPEYESENRYEVRDRYLKIYFGKSEIYNDINEVYQKARDIYRCRKQEGFPVEYGISEIDMREIDFPA